MATHVRTVLFTAIIEEKKSTRLAQRFDRALNTMSHGLVMLDPDGRVVVANAEAERRRSARKSADALLGRSLKALVMRGVAAACSRQGRPLSRGPADARAARGPRPQDPGALVNGQHYEFSASEGAGGLGVIIFEDVTLASRRRTRSARWRGTTI